MNQRERLQAALEHRAPDRVPVDFGATAVTGIHVAALSRLRQAVTGDKAWRVKVIEPYQMLGELDAELGAALGIDVAGLVPRKTMFGFENAGWQPFRLFDGTEVLVPENFRTTAEANGDLLIYPEGDLGAPPSGRVPLLSHAMAVSIMCALSRLWMKLGGNAVRCLALITGRYSACTLHGA